MDPEKKKEPWSLRDDTVALREDWHTVNPVFTVLEGLKEKAQRAAEAQKQAI